MICGNWQSITLLIITRLNPLNETCQGILTTVNTVVVFTGSNSGIIQLKLQWWIFWRNWAKGFKIKLGLCLVHLIKRSVLLNICLFSCCISFFTNLVLRVHLMFAAEHILNRQDRCFKWEKTHQSTLLILQLQRLSFHLFPWDLMTIYNSDHHHFNSQQHQPTKWH